MQWVSLACEYEGNETWIDLATQAARWGADAELEACCEWLASRPSNWESTAPELADDIRIARRPQPPSLAEEALEQLSGIRTAFKAAYGGDLIDNTISAALERLQQLELENNG